MSCIFQIKTGNPRDHAFAQGRRTKYVYCDKWRTREPKAARASDSETEASAFMAEHHPDRGIVAIPVVCGARQPRYKCARQQYPMPHMIVRKEDL